MNIAKYKHKHDPG